MFKKISTRELVFLTLAGTAWFLLDLAIGLWINAVTGIFLLGSFLGAIISGFFVALLVKIRPKFFTFTITLLIFGLLALPTSSAGPAGFWPKILIEPLVGLLGDIFLKLAKYKRWSIFAAFYILSAGLLYSLTLAMIAMGIPEASKTLALLHFVTLGFWIIGTIGLLFGFYVYKKGHSKF